MNAFLRVPYYLRHPALLVRHRYKIRLIRRMSYTFIQSFRLQEKFRVHYYGADFHPFPTSLSLALWLYGEKFRAQDMRFLLSLLRAGDTFIDVGANIGTHSLCVAARLGDSSPIYSFEPHPRVFQYLVKNVSLNRRSNIQLFNVALGEEEGTVYISNDVLDDRNRIAAEAEGAVAVPLKPLDSFDCVMQGFATLKLDVEGYELFVLRGGARSVAQLSCIYLEVGDRHSLPFGYTAHDILRYLYNAGWDLLRFCPTEQDTLVRITPNYSPPDVENIVAVRSVEALQERLGTAFKIV